MQQLTIGFGTVLILTGIIAYLGTGQESMTSLLPSIAGIPIVIAGLVAARPDRERIGLYIAAVLTAILAVGTLRGATKLLEGDATTAALVNGGLLVISVVYLAAFAAWLRNERRINRAG